MKNTQVGIPSPNPSYPSPVEVVKGDNEVVVSNKNLAILSKISTTSEGYITRDNSSICQIKAGITYTLSMKCSTEYTSTTKNLSIRNYYVEGTTTHEILSDLTYKSGQRVNTSFTPTQNGTLSINAALGNEYIDVLTEIQLEHGSTVTNYIEHQEQVYPISLGSIELAKIGSYQDKLFKAINGDVVYDSLSDTQKEGLTEGKWYKYGEIGKVVLNGTEDWENPTTNLYNVNSIIPNHISTTNIVGIISNNYIGSQTKSSNSEFLSAVSSIDYATGLHTNGTSIRFKDSRGLTLEAFQTWLSTHNTTVYYVLATPTYTEITDTTLITQLENWRNSKSYNGQTNISQTNGDKAFVISYTTLKDVYAELDSRLKALEG